MNRSVSKSCITHEYDENACLMNVSNTCCYETDVDDLMITADKGFRQRLIIATETIQQVLEIEAKAHHRKINFRREILKLPVQTKMH